MKLQDCRQKLHAAIVSLTNMNAKTNPWRDRFLQVAREAQAEISRPKARSTGLRPRSRMAGFALLRRSARGTGLSRLA